MSLYLIDLDDFCEENTDWELIVYLKKIVPSLKLNLFTIPGRCTREFIEEMRKVEWLRLYPHGYYHRTSRECENWNYEVSDNCLYQLEKEGWPRLWKSPGWQTSDELFLCLSHRGWAIADQEYNNRRRPQEMKVYLLDSPYKVHGHIGHLGGFNQNSLELIFDVLSSLKGEFGFIDDLWNHSI